jgi:DNA repair exonuclease SbcCD ATPase subunit
MSNLTLYQQNQIQEITTEAISVIEAHPVARQHLGKLTESIVYLAYCAVQDCTDAHLADIQKLIDVAKAGQSAELLRMNRSIQAEMQQLRSQMRLGFEAIAQVLDTLDQQHNQMYSALDERLSRLENQSPLPPEPQVVYVREQPVNNYYVDNSYTDNSRHSNRGEGVGVEALAWTIVAIFFTVLACSILPYGRR